MLFKKHERRKMVIDLTKNNSISALNNFDPDICIKYYQALGLDHSSPSQDNMSDSDWLCRYVFLMNKLGVLYKVHIECQLA